MTPVTAEEEDFVFTLTVTDVQTQGLRTFPRVVALCICPGNLQLVSCDTPQQVESPSSIAKNVNLNRTPKSSNVTET